MESQIKDILNAQIKKINDSKGTFLTNRIYQIQISLLTFEKNYKDLETSLINFSNPKISSKLWELGHKERARLYLWNVSRFLQNFLSSAFTFREHLRFITRKVFKEHIFLKEFAKQVNDTFADDPLSNFIMRFRNTYLHTCVAGISASFNLEFNKNRINSEILLIKSQLLNSSNEWNSQSLKFISSMEEEVPLLQIMRRYFDKVYKFYEWYEKRYFKIFENDFNELNKLKEDYNQIQKNIFKIK